MPTGRFPVGETVSRPGAQPRGRGGPEWGREIDVIDVQQVRELIELMVEHDLSEIRIKQGDTTVSLRRGPAGPAVVYHEPPVPSAGVGPAVPAAPTDQEEGFVPVTSPMVGTFYVAPDPESPPFVKVGTEVSPQTTVCIIEAMKVFNEIQAEAAGTIERILVPNGQAVEYGQPLMMIRPKG